MLECEPPNNKIYNFDGTLTIQNSMRIHEKELISINEENVLLRGTKLVNTEWIYGLVIFTGIDTKIEQNTTITPHKRSYLEKNVNTKLLFIFLLQTFVCIICSIGSNNWDLFKRKSNDSVINPWYLGDKQRQFTYLSYIILYNTV